MGNIRVAVQAFSLQWSSLQCAGFSSWSNKKLCLTVRSVPLSAHWQWHEFSTSVAPLCGITRSAFLFDISANNDLKNHPLLFKIAAWNISPSFAMWQQATNGITCVQPHEATSIKHCPRCTAGLLEIISHWRLETYAVNPRSTRDGTF